MAQSASLFTTGKMWFKAAALSKKPVRSLLFPVPEKKPRKMGKRTRKLREKVEACAEEIASLLINDDYKGGEPINLT